jgi:cytochrome c peroxidase
MLELARDRRWLTAALTPIALVSASCGKQAVGPADQTPPPFDWQLPPGFPTPRVPADDPMTVEKVALGRHLFYDQRLSGNQTESCASCHQQALAFTDGKQTSVGSTGDIHPRAAMSLANVGYAPVLTWADNTLTQLTEQMLTPMFGEDPVELGLGGMKDELLNRVRGDTTYQSLFPKAFPGEADPFTIDNLTRAIASFERTLISGNAPEDRFREGDQNALSASAQAGHDLFFSDSLKCSKCHSGADDGGDRDFFTSNFDFDGRTIPHIQFDNTGLYNLIGTDGQEGWYPDPNQGLYNVTGRSDDIGRFKVPTLRNVALTAPYMHDGSIATLDEVLDHYAAGGRTIDSGPNAGVGSQNPHKSQFITGFTITTEQRQELIDFLNSLTDEEFVTDVRFSNPWPAGSPALGQ